MKILITGITGFIGKNLAKALIDQGKQVSGVIYLPQEKEILDKKNIGYFFDDDKADGLINFFEKETFDGVIHLAACYYLEHTHQQIENLIISNILFSTRILDAAVRSGVKWFINTGSFWQNFNNKDYSPVNLYAATKEAFGAIAKFYSENFDINFVNLKLFDTYGLGDVREKVFNVWKRIIQNGEPFNMSPGEQLVDIVYIDDVVSAYVTMVDLLSYEDARKFNTFEFVISSGFPRRLKEIARIFSEVSGKRLNINWGAKPYRKNEVMVPWSRGRTIPGWKPKISLEQGIAKLLAIDE